MIPKTLFVAFLSLRRPVPMNSQGGVDPDHEITGLYGLNAPASSSQEGAETHLEINGVGRLEAPAFQPHDAAQVLFRPPLSRNQHDKITRESHIIDFNSFPPGQLDPSKASFPDGFQLTIGNPYIYSLKDAFPQIPHPAGIEHVFGNYPSGVHIGFYFRRPGHTTNVSIEFAYVENDALKSGSWNSSIWTLTSYGWIAVTGPQGKFDGTKWATTTSIKEIGDRFEFYFRGAASDSVLLISRVFYT